jgi:hypothetical protein
MEARSYSPVAFPRGYGGTWEIVDAGIDYLSFVSRIDEAAAELRTVGLRITDFHREQGGMIRPWRWQGYVGEGGDGVATGWRLDSSIVVLQGSNAHLYASELKNVVGRARRLDVQATYCSTEPTGATAEYVYQNRMFMRDRMGRHLQQRLIQASDGGQTVYLGATSSQKMLRLYRKDIQSPTEYPRYSWRWEVQLRDVAAAATWLRHSDDLVQRPFAPAFVAAMFTAAGSPVPWPYTPRVAIEHLPQRKWDRERCMEWLRSSVAPAVERLLAYYDIEEVKDALGLAVMNPQPQAGGETSSS